MAFELHWVRQNLHRQACVRYRVALSLSLDRTLVYLMRLLNGNTRLFTSLATVTTGEVLHIDERKTWACASTSAPRCIQGSMLTPPEPLCSCQKTTKIEMHSSKARQRLLRQVWKGGSTQQYVADYSISNQQLIEIPMDCHIAVAIRQLSKCEGRLSAMVTT